MIMRTTALLGASLVIALASACGGGGGGNNNGTCGDGEVTGSEQCDDGNTVSGDGCSSTCTTESTSGHCGDGIVDVATEQCDDGNTASGDGCSSTCQNEISALCGNGQIDGSEACDDNNTTSGDGCSNACAVENGYTCTGTPSVCTMVAQGDGMCATPFTLTFTGTTTMTATASGDTTSSTSQVGEADCDGFGPEGLGNDHIYKFTTTDVRDLTIEIGANTAFSALVRLMTAPCDLSTEIPEFLGAADGCADVDGSGYLGYVNLPAGTYYLLVDSYDPSELGAYEINLTATTPACGDGMVNPQLEFCDDGNTMSTDGCSANCEVETGYTCTAPATGPSVCEMIGCGDGILQTGEDCDDHNTATGDGCDDMCHVETGYTCDTTVAPSVCVMMGCGNGLVETGEECDDGNMVSGDCCDSSCMLESDVAEAEPNDTTPQVLTAGNHIVRGLYSNGETDLYSFTLTAPSTVEIETYYTIDGTATNYGGVGNSKFDCEDGDDTVVAVFAAGADVTDDTAALAIDNDDGDLYCSYVGPNDADGPDPTQLMDLPAGTYTIRVTDDPFTTIMDRRYLLDLKITPMTAAVTPAPGDIVLNEFMAADSTTADTNCDGSTTGTADEFVELVNVSAKTLDLTGLTITDGGPVLQHTFAPAATGSMTLLPGKAVVVWGAGAPACPGVSDWFVASSGQLSLNDAGDTITLATGDATPVTLFSVTYPAATTAISSNLSPDVTGTTYADHNTVSGAVGNFSPGLKADGTPF